MKKEGIQIEIFCDFHNIDIQLINSFIDKGFIKVVKEKEITLIPLTDIENVERYVRLSNDLGVNLAGLEVISHMRSRMLELRKELAYLKGLERQILGSDGFDNEEDIIDY